MAKIGPSGKTRRQSAGRSSNRAAPAGTGKPSTGIQVSLPWKAIGIAFAFLVVVVVVAYAAYEASNGPGNGPVDWQRAELDSKTSVPGEVYVPPHPGQDGVLCITRECISAMDDRLHVAEEIPICTQQQLDSKNYSNPLCYNSNPPTSGPHNPNPMPFKVLDNPAQAGNLIHNMEHGGIVIWYNTADQAVIKQLTSITDDALNQRHFVVMTKYTAMESETVALTSWTRMLKLPSAETSSRAADIVHFISENDRRFNPEGF